MSYESARGGGGIGSGNNRGSPSRGDGDGGGNAGPGGNRNRRVVPRGPTRFERAGDIQAKAYMEGADIESDFLRQAIESLRGYDSGYGSFVTAGQDALTGLQEGSTIDGFGDRLNEIIGGDAYEGLIDERFRGLNSQLASSGLRRSGAAMNEAAALPMDLAMEIEGMLSERQGGIAGMGLNAAQSQGGVEQMIAQLMGHQGSVKSEGITGAAEAKASGIIGELAYQQNAKRDKNDQTSQLIGLGLAAMSMFSDPRLKKNVKKEGKIGPLDLISWEWIDKAKDTIVSKCNTFGFMSTQVKEVYPDCVSEFGGYDVVDYGKLIGRLKCL